MGIRQEHNTATPLTPRWSPRIMHPEDFDTAAASMDLPIFACTTMPLSRFREDLAEVNMNSDHWIERVCARSVISKRFMRTSRHTLEFLVPPLATVHFNRETFAAQQGTKDVLLDHPEAAQVFFSNRCCGSLMHLNRKYREFAPVHDERTLKNLIKAANTYPAWVLSADEITACSEHLFKTFGSIERIDNFLRTAADRRGVQVVYGGIDFERWYAGSGARSAGDIPGGEVLKMRIPLQYALAALPLGPYEQALLPDGQLLEESPRLSQVTISGTPRAAAPEETSRMAEPDSQSQAVTIRAGRKIALVVDDRSSHLDATRMAVEGMGFQVETAMSLEEARNRVIARRDKPYDLIVSDYDYGRTLWQKNRMFDGFRFLKWCVGQGLDCPMILHSTVFEPHQKFGLFMHGKVFRVIPRAKSLGIKVQPKSVLISGT